MPRGPSPPIASTAMNGPRRRVPPDQTNAENYYYIKQMAAKTAMVIKLIDGEEIHGVIEWYDRNCIKVHRSKEPNLLVFKHTIRYMFKENELKDDYDDVVSGDG
ncbi:MAG: RNA chaperone Hfq [Acidobacteria bacterium]|nr:RNA chaperone Hfq [Acidobacteriota bacterium]MBI3654809.1 RNA chaperone Hfq [Acidobacteriota bacterium]